MKLHGEPPAPVTVGVASSRPFTRFGIAGLLQHSGDRVTLVEPGAACEVVLLDAVELDDDAGSTVSQEVLGAPSTPVVAIAPGFGPDLADVLVAVRDRAPVDRLAVMPGVVDAAHTRAGVGLSAREHQIVGLIAGGMGNAEIADSLYLSINSVKTYIRQAYRKIGVTTRSQAVRWAVERGQVSLAGADPHRAP